MIFNNPNASISIEAMLKKGLKVPGWGSSFYKGEVDPAFLELHEYLKSFCENFSVADAVSEHISKFKGKPIVMNPSFYTVMVGIILELPPHAIQNLLIQPRIAAWMDYVETNRK